MVTCAIFNYQFDKIIEHARQGEFEGMESVVMTADEAFPQRQDIFGGILSKAITGSVLMIIFRE